MALPNEEHLRAMVFAATFLGLHILISAQDVGSFLFWLLRGPGPKVETDPWASRLQMALAESRRANFFQFARFGSFVGAGAQRMPCCKPKDAISWCLDFGGRSLEASAFLSLSESASHKDCFRLPTRRLSRFSDAALLWLCERPFSRVA